MRNMITMITVSDMDRSVRFYRDTLGLKLRFQSPDWSEFDAGVRPSRCMAAVNQRQPRPVENKSQALLVSVSM